MFCPKCGTKLPEKAAFCHSCGVAQPSVVASQSKAESRTEATQASSSLPELTKTLPTAQAWGLLALVVAMFIGIAVWPENQPESPEGPIVRASKKPTAAPTTAEPAARSEPQSPPPAAAVETKPPPTELSNQKTNNESAKTKAPATQKPTDKTGATQAGAPIRERRQFSNFETVLLMLGGAMGWWLGWRVYPHMLSRRQKFTKAKIDVFFARVGFSAMLGIGGIMLVGQMLR